MRGVRAEGVGGMGGVTSVPLGVGGAGVGQRQGAGQDAHAVSGLNGEWTSLREGGCRRARKGIGSPGRERVRGEQDWRWTQRGKWREEGAG